MTVPATRAPAITPPKMTLRLNAAERAALNRTMMRLADGDRTAFQSIFAALWPRVHLWSTRLLGDAAAGEDVAQQAMMKLFEQAHRFNPEGDVLTWGLTLALWECRTYRRKAVRRVAVTLPEPTPYPTAEQIAIDEDLQVTLEELLGELSEADQRLLRLGRGDNSEPMTATMRKRRERALSRLKLLWRTRHEQDV